jgi:3-oxoadipate enol-lactonase
MKKAVINNIEIAYEEFGSPQGLPVLFIHGFPFAGSMWQRQMQALPPGIRAITYDIRGHGASTVGDGLYTIEYFVDDAIGLLDHLQIANAIFCGLSMGGYIALRAAERYPGRIQGLVLCSTKSEPDTDEAKVKRSATIETIRRLGVQPFADQFVHSIFRKETFHSNPSAAAFIGTIINHNSPIGICGTSLALAARTDTTRALSSLHVPALVLAGEEDDLAPPEVMRAMSEKIPGAEFHVIPQAAHMSNLENSDEFNRLLFQFLISRRRPENHDV